MNFTELGKEGGAARYLAGTCRRSDVQHGYIGVSLISFTLRGRDRSQQINATDWRLFGNTGNIRGSVSPPNRSEGANSGRKRAIPVGGAVDKRESASWLCDGIETERLRSQSI